MVIVKILIFYTVFKMSFSENILEEPIIEGQKHIKLKVLLFIIFIILFSKQLIMELMSLYFLILLKLSK